VSVWSHYLLNSGEDLLLVSQHGRWNYGGSMCERKILPVKLGSKEAIGNGLILFILASSHGD
jgi:hypothetical protein